MHEKKEGFRTLTKWLDLGRGRKCNGLGNLRVRKSFRSRESFLSREKWENENQIVPQLYIEKRNSMDRGAIKISRTKSRLKWICRGAVEDLSTAKVPRWIEKLSRIYRPDRKFLDGSRSYRDKFQKAWWIEIALTSIEKRRMRGLIDANLSRICREAVELEENEFFKERKNTEMNATSKLLKHRSNQHVKLSKISLKKNKNAKHSWSKTHTHTLNKSNQFFISNFLFQKQVMTV